MIIICEGPDNGGKTTLAQYIAKKMRAVYIKVERPKRAAVDLMAYQKILHVAANYSGLVVSDRHVAISEPIYGPICRGGHDLDEREIHECFDRIDAVIYCRPPLPTIMKTIDDRPQMEGVIENTTRIVQAYDDFFDDTLRERRWRFMGVYNFINDKPELVVENLNQYQDFLLKGRA